MVHIRSQAQFGSYTHGAVEQLVLIVEVSGIVTPTGEDQALVIDRSASMSMDGRWNTVLALLRALEESRAFAVFTFNDDVQRCETLDDVLRMYPDGATNQARALEAALQNGASSIVLVTDGEPVGVSEEAVLDACRCVEDLRIIGISPSPYFREFLEKMAGDPGRLQICSGDSTIMPIAQSLYGTAAGGSGAILQPYEGVTIERVIQLYPSTQEVGPSVIPLPSERTQFLIKVSGTIPQGVVRWKVARLTVEEQAYSLAVPVEEVLGEECEAITAAADEAQLATSIQNGVPREVVLQMARTMLVSNPMSLLAQSLVGTGGQITVDVEAKSIMPTKVGG